MIIHPAKTKSMVIATRQKHQLSPLQLELTLEKTDTEQVHEHRVLGVTIDAEIKWQSQLSNVCKTVSKTLFLLSQLTTRRNSLPTGQDITLRHVRTVCLQDNISLHDTSKQSAHRVSLFDTSEQPAERISLYGKSEQPVCMIRHHFKTR